MQTIAELKSKDLEPYTPPRAEPEVDSILSGGIVLKPDFDHPDRLIQQIDTGFLRFAEDVFRILFAAGHGQDAAEILCAAQRGMKKQRLRLCLI